jgi:RNA polymerase sigma-70 factor (ECF subfamily)
MSTMRRGAARLLGQGKRGEQTDARLVMALKEGDEQAFMSLVERHHASLLRIARMYVPSAEVAEDVVQETWIAVLNGIGRFERRSSLKTWIYSILVNIAKTRGQRERRSIPFSAATPLETQGPSVDPDRFFSPDDPRTPPGGANGWALAPTRWETPEESLLSGETRELILRTIDQLSPAQREVITLRDLEGWSAAEVCNALEITETNQRVLLHRARSKVRASLEHYFGAMEPTV